MRFSIYLLLLVFSLVQCKTHVKALTESLGQEVIEIGTPIKELPPELEEEPSAEFEVEEKTSTSGPPATKRETKKTTTPPPATTTQKEVSELQDSLSPEEDEKRLEKEFSEIYKDTDYKASAFMDDSSSKNATVEITETIPILRQKGRSNFKFQPDVNDRADVERFRTSVDDISCEKRVTQRLQDVKDSQLLLKRFYSLLWRNLKKLTPQIVVS